MTSPICAFIFARGGSKGLPGKNIRMLAGKPLIAHAIAQAQASQLISRVIVSTDDSEIASVAEAYGAEVPFMRPAPLAGDTSAEWFAWQHAITRLRELEGERACGLFVSVPAPAPLRKTEDIDACIHALLNTPGADLAFTVTPSHANPYFTMVRKSAGGFAELSATLSTPVSRRQDAPAVFDIAGLAYAARPEFIMSAENMWQGNIAMSVVPRERAVDIDTPYDFHLAELLMREPFCA